MQLEHTDKSAEGETVSKAQAKHILHALMALLLLEAVLLTQISTFVDADEIILQNNGITNVFFHLKTFALSHKVNCYNVPAFYYA